MSKSWQQTTLHRLLTAQDPNGGWGYHARATPCAEPTALACMALSDSPDARLAVENGLQWLAHLQRKDGGVKICEDVPAPCWPTGLAALAWLHPPSAGPDQHRDHIERAISWLCRTKGLPIPPRPDVFGHDTTLTGWSWVEGTHSWIEPTAYATWALRQAGLAQHKRTTQGIEVMLDRAIPGGGWNYGNTKVLGNQLRPFPGTTGLVLVALAGVPRDKPIDAAIDYLHRELQRIHAPITLSWGLMGLAAWRQTPLEAPDWLRECAEQIADDEPSPFHDALLLMAHTAVTAPPIAMRGHFGV